MGPSRMMLSKPVIAAVSGYAVAGGLELAVWCDLRVVEEDATFGVFCRRWGVPLIDGGTVRLPRLIGHSRAMDLILTGRAVDAAEALQIGLANRVVPHGQARAKAEELAHELAALPQLCLRADRMSALRQWGESEESAMEFEFASLAQVAEESLAGAQRFTGGAGRHGAKA
jgi:enoyl-CoA hydratase